MSRKRRTKEQIKDIVWSKTDGLCARCGDRSPASRRTIDHYVPKIVGGEDDLRNYIPLCKRCNQLKAYRMVDIKSYYPYLPGEYAREALEYEKNWKSIL